MIPKRPAGFGGGLTAKKESANGFYAFFARRTLVTDDQNTADDARDAARYRWLRSRDLNTIAEGGVFAGRTPENVVLNGEDLDRAVDGAMQEVTLMATLGLKDAGPVGHA